MCDGEVIWSGGFRVASEGNNYVGEYAAACLAVALAPPKSPLDLFEDNQGAIAAQMESNPTERRRVRSAARAWRNTFRCYINLRSAPTRIEYVRSHTHKTDYISQGNDAADVIAKWARIQPLPLLDAPGEEPFILRVKGKVVKNDIFVPLKEKCLELSLQKWTSCRKQGELARMDPKVTLNQSLKALSLAYEYHRGDLWLFYVFAVCNWLPTEYRRSKGVMRDGKCTLCLENQPETQKHLLTCPALNSTQLKLQGVVSDNFRRLLTAQLCDPQEDFIKETGLWIRNHIKGSDLRIQESKLVELVDMFVSTNWNRMGLSRSQCRAQVVRLLKQRKCFCGDFGRHSCYLRNCWRTPSSFVRIIRQAFHTNCEGMADALSHNSLFEKWCSEFPEDEHFGANFDFFQTDLAGHNTFVNPPFNSAPNQPGVLLKTIDRCVQLASFTL